MFSDSCLLTTRATSLGVSFLSLFKVLKISFDLFFIKGRIGNKNIDLSKNFKWAKVAENISKSYI